MVEGIAEVLDLWFLGGSLRLFLLGVWTMLATVATVTTVAAVATVGAAVIAVTSLTTLATLRALTALATGWALDVVGGFLDEYTMRELVLAGLRVDLQKLHLDVVALLDASLLDGLETLPVNL